MRFEVVRDIQTVRLSDIRHQTSDGPFGPAVGSLYNYIWPPLLKKPYNRALGIGRAIHRKVLYVQAKDQLCPTWRPSAGSPQRENMPTRLRLMEMHPYPRFAVLPPEGEVYSPLSFRTHKQLKA